jgi:HEAT repeat protein
MTMPSGAELALPVAQVEELVRTIAKGLRAFQLYLPNNPIYQRAEQAIRDAFLPIWSSTPTLVLALVETDIHWEGQVVYHQPSRHDSLAWMMYKDGMRQLTLRPGVESAELVRFLKLVTRARLLASDAADDLLTLLWEEDFQQIDYQFAEIITETLGVLDPQAIDMAIQQDPAAQVAVQEEIRTDAADRLNLGLDLDDFDSTLYFLDEQEIQRLRGEVDNEYARDERKAALEALLDIFELQPTVAVRQEVLDIFDHLFPNLLNRGEFRTVAGMLREFRTIGLRITALDPELHHRLQSFQARLSEPAILSQLLQSLEEAEAMPPDEDVGEVLRELHAEGLETMLTFLPTLKRPAVRRILESSIDRLATAHVEVVMAILERFESAALPGAIGLCARLNLQASVSPLDKLVAHPDPVVRRAAVEALASIGSPGALTALERALDDPDRAVRLATVTAVASKGYRAALKRLEAVVLGRGPHELERAERRQFFEAYAAVAGAAALPVLSNILEPRRFLRKKESPEVRTCAAYAIARLQSPEARALLERIQHDKELAVRNAATRALRDWPE